MNRLTDRLTYANVVSTLCLFVLLGGGAYAATQLPDGSVGAAQLKAGAVTGPKVRDGSLLARDFKRGQLPGGPRGAPGPSGRSGQAGRSADQFNAFARVTSSGAVDPLHSRSVSQLSAQRLDEGRYCVLTLIQAPGSDVVGSPRNAVVTPEDEDRTAAARTSPQPTSECAGGTLVTLTNTVDGTREDGAFYVLLGN